MSGGTFSTRVAAFFIRSHLTPLLIVVSIALGLFATVTTAKEEEPSITIAMFDVAIAWPGHDTAEVDERLARPVAAWVRELPGAEHVLSASADDATLLAVQFRQGVRREDAFTQLSERLNARSSLLPEGASVLSFTPRGVEDVPVLAFSITSDASSPEELRRHAVAVSRTLEQQSNVASVAVLGGAQRAFRVEVDPARLSSYRLDIDAVHGAIRHANLELPAARASRSFARGRPSTRCTISKGFRSRRRARASSAFVTWRRCATSCANRRPTSRTAAATAFMLVSPIR
ncbi:MAG: efflux RND transporter permease subunit [Myxococcales bacterium]|nr:efflux RND transporter permease subunit [Myxococcales bacterium]